MELEVLIVLFLINGSLWVLIIGVDWGHYFKEMGRGTACLLVNKCIRSILGFKFPLSALRMFAM